jgi:hypothetical protein
MAIKIEIKDTALVITDTVSGEIQFSSPVDDVWCNTAQLSKGSINFINKQTRISFSEIPNYLLGDCINSLNEPFTEFTFATFAHSKLGKLSTTGIGTEGPQGVQGLPGNDGANGANGANGIDGIDGISAYEVALANGFVGTEVEWLASLVGADGADGAQGIQGIQGIQGEPGVGGGGGGTPGGVDRNIQFNDAGAFEGASKVNIGTEGNLLLDVNLTQPTAPTTDKIQIYGKKKAGADWLEYQRSNGREIPLQHHMGVNRVATWTPVSVVTVLASGMPRTAVGSTFHPTVSGGSIVSSMRRWSLTSAATANSPADERCNVWAVFRGNAPGLGGFTYTNRIAMSTLNATARGFFGLSGSTGTISGSQNLLALTTCFGIGFNLATDANWQIYKNGASGTITPIDMGASFPVNSLTNVLTIFIYAEPNGSGIGIRVVEEVSGAVFEDFYTTGIPNDVFFMSPRNYMSNGATATAVSFDCAGVYLESDY